MSIRNSLRVSLLAQPAGFLRTLALNAGKYRTLEIFDEIFRKMKAGTPVVAYGCMVDRYPQEIRKALPEVKDFFHTEQPAAPLDRISEILGTKKGKFSLLERKILGTVDDRDSAYLVISDGCDFRCKYCPLPNYRGRYRSRPMQELLEEVKMITNRGTRKLMVAGLETTGYGRDLGDGSSISRLLSQISAVRRVEEIELVLANPEGFTDELINYIINGDCYLNLS